MKKNRREFLQLAGAFTTGTLIVPSIACKSTGQNMGSNAMSSNRLERFGIQLYTLRADLPKDPKGILKQVADMGFHQIEGYEGPQGMFWNMGHKDFKKYLDDLGIEMVASHCNIRENFEQKVEQAAEIGMKYLICPSIGPQKSVKAWGDVTNLFNSCGEICKKSGIRFAYHNHAYSFKPFMGMIPHDFMMDNTDPDLVDHEMDIYWVVTGGADPVEYLNKYPNRFRLCHVKDRLKDASEKDTHASCDLGTGMIDFPKVLKAAKENGMKYYLLEQERYDNSTPLTSAAAGATYLKNFKFS